MRTVPLVVGCSPSKSIGRGGRKEGSEGGIEGGRVSGEEGGKDYIGIRGNRNREGVFSLSLTHTHTHTHSNTNLEREWLGASAFPTVPPTSVPPTAAS